MDTAKLFKNGKSQAVRLPKAFRFDGDEVYIKKVADGVLLLPKSGLVWDTWKNNLMKYDEPLLEDRNQAKQQNRTGIDEIFD